MRFRWHSFARLGMLGAMSNFGPTFLLCFGLSLVPLSVSAQAFTDDLPAARGARHGVDDRNVRLLGNLALGFAGELDSQVNDARGEADLDPSVGFDLRVEVPVLDFLVIGAQFEFLGILTDASGAEREEMFGFDGYVRLRWAFDVTSDFVIEPYLFLPLGFAMAVLPDDDGSGDDIWPGWNTGAMAGAQFIHDSGFGGYLELGWRHAEAYYDTSVFGVSVDASLILNELALNVGFVYAFGG
jgi:hypothetical protein